MEIKKSKHVGCYRVIFNKNGEVLLIKKSRAAYKGKLDLPGGKIEYGESPEDALKRELLEEIGLNILDYKLREFITHYEIWNIDDNLKEDLSHYAIIYDCVINDKDLDNIKKDADGLDSLGASWYNINDLKESELSPLVMCIK